MNSNKFSIFCIYTENNEGTLDELIVDTFNREYSYTGNVDEKELAFHEDGKIKGFKVDRGFFDYYVNLLDKMYAGEYYVNEGDYETRRRLAEHDAKEEKSKPLIGRETVWKALRMELSKEELSKVCLFKYRLPKDNYYDFDLFIANIHEFMEGRVEVSTFDSWCVVVMRCLENCMDTKSEKLKSFYYDIGDYFDGMAFMSPDISEEDKRVQCLEAIAWLKYQNHLVQNAKSRKATLFETNGVMTYVSFAFSLND